MLGELNCVQVLSDLVFLFEVKITTSEFTFQLGYMHLGRQIEIFIP